MSDRRRQYYKNKRFNKYDELGESSTNHSSRGGRPSNLRGKDIGLYYANKQRKKKEEDTKRPLGTILLSESRVVEIKKLLNNVVSVQNISNYNEIQDSEFKTDFLNIIHGTLDNRLNQPDLMKTIPKSGELDEKYYAELNDKIATNLGYQRLLPIRQKLPSYGKRFEITRLVRENQVCVIGGETGCGKTTQVAQFILDDYISSKNGSICRIVCTQPRRISAISVAERVAQERGESCGKCSVGYQIRLEKKLPRRTGSITFCTTGVLLQQMQSDPFLSATSHVILDEIHERDITSDFLIALLKQILQKRRDLKVILMSATLNAEQFSKYFHSCPCLTIPGFTFPVETYYLEDVLTSIRFEFPKERAREQKAWMKHLPRERQRTREKDVYRDFIEPYVRNIRAKRTYPNRVSESLLNPNSEQLNVDLIFELLKFVCTKEEEGAVLIFLPGLTDISKLNTKINDSSFFSKSNYLIIQLHSKMPSVHQKEIFCRPRAGVRKIVIATNIAETSITIDDVVYVIDCGKIKMSNYDLDANLETLQPEWVSLANANQRKGRAGRVQPGVCYHLFSKARKMVLDSHQKPEIQRCKLENIILTVKILQLGKTEDFLMKLMDPPEFKAIENGLILLKQMNALDEEEKLTPLGYHLAKLPVKPQMGKMILFGALFSCLDPILSIAASLDFKDAFYIPLGKQKEFDTRKKELLSGWKSDHLVLAEALRQYEQAKYHNEHRDFCYRYFLSAHTLELLINMKKQFAEYLHEMNFLTDNNVKNQNWNINSKNFSLIKAIVCASLYPNVAITKTRRKIQTTSHERVELHPSSVNHGAIFESPLLVYCLKLKSTAIYLHDTTMVHPLPLLFFGDHLKIDDASVISLSNILRFKTNLETAVLIKQLREQLNRLFQYKISHPGTVDWTTNGDEVVILRAIMQLITSEDMGLLDFDLSENESD